MNGRFLQHPSGRLLLVVALLIAYGSLYPLNFSQPPPGAWDGFLNSWGGQQSPGDSMGNVALFVPFGLFAWFALQGKKPGQRIATILVAALVFSASLQVLQLFLRARDPALVDIAWNLAGTLAGLLLVIPVGRFGGALEVPIWTTALPFLLVGVWLVGELTPLVPTLDFGAIKQSLAPIKRLHWRFPPTFLAVGQALALGCLLENFLHARRARVILWLLLATAVAGKLIMLYQYLTLHQLCGWLTGGMIWLSLARTRLATRQKIGLLWLWLAYTIVSLEPFALREVPRAFVWLPFKDVLTGTMLYNVQALLPRLFVIAAIIWLASELRTRVWSVAIFLALWVAALEGAQTYLVGRVGAISDSLWVLLVTFTIVQLKRRSGSQ